MTWTYFGDAETPLPKMMLRPRLPSMPPPSAPHYASSLCSAHAPSLCSSLRLLPLPLLASSLCSHLCQRSFLIAFLLSCASHASRYYYILYVFHVLFHFSWLPCLSVCMGCMLACPRALPCACIQAFLFLISYDIYYIVCI